MDKERQHIRPWKEYHPGKCVGRRSSTRSDKNRENTKSSFMTSSTFKNSEVNPPTPYFRFLSTRPYKLKYDRGRESLHEP